MLPAAALIAPASARVEAGSDATAAEHVAPRPDPVRLRDHVPQARIAVEGLRQALQRIQPLARVANGQHVARRVAATDPARLSPEVEARELRLRALRHRRDAYRLL